VWQNHLATILKNKIVAMSLEELQLTENQASSWTMKPKDDMWYIYYEGKAMMKSKKLCRVLKE